MTMNRKLFAKGFRHGIPIGLGYLSVAFTFGMKAVADGLSPLEALLISMTNVTSAGQFAGLPLILAQASYLEVALTQLIINLRYALMSLSISQKMDSDMNTPRRLLFSFMNADEIFAVASSQPGKVGHWYLYGLMIAPYLGWSVGTILGAVRARCCRFSSAMRSVSRFSACSLPSSCRPRARRSPCALSC